MKLPPSKMDGLLEMVGKSWEFLQNSCGRI